MSGKNNGETAPPTAPSKRLAAAASVSRRTTAPRPSVFATRLRSNGTRPRKRAVVEASASFAIRSTVSVMAAAEASSSQAITPRSVTFGVVRRLPKRPTMLLAGAFGSRSSRRMVSRVSAVSRSEAASAAPSATSRRSPAWVGSSAAEPWPVASVRIISAT